VTAKIRPQRGVLEEEADDSAHGTGPLPGRASIEAKTVP
jgi:hypothetical protein